jgi:hypothetical protein
MGGRQRVKMVSFPENLIEFRQSEESVVVFAEHAGLPVVCKIPRSAGEILPDVFRILNPVE